MTPQITPWEVWWTNFDPLVSRAGPKASTPPERSGGAGGVDGHEQAGLRPAIVVGTAFACQLPNQLVVVVPCATTDRQLPFHPLVTSLGRSSFAMCDQVKSISRERLTRRHPARLGSEEIGAVKFVLRQLIDTR